MKKVSFFSVLVLAVITFTSCNKTTLLPSVVETDNPPKELWAPNQIYLQAYTGYAKSEDLSSQELKGYYAPCQGAQSTFQQGYWYLLQVHKYYGIYEGTIYISKERINCAIMGDNLLMVQEAVNRTGATRLSMSMGANNGFNPIGADYTLFGVYY
ncbi:MAG: hypothetical protein WCO35_00135 [Candidatus Nomurabacteria bacterium]